MSNKISSAQLHATKHGADVIAFQHGCASTYMTDRSLSAGSNDRPMPESHGMQCAAHQLFCYNLVDLLSPLAYFLSCVKVIHVQHALQLCL